MIYQINKIPFVLKNVPLAGKVKTVRQIIAEEGQVILVEAGNHEGKLNVLDFKGGRLGFLWQKEIIPAVLGNRKATTEFAGYIPSKIKTGDELYLLCESGVVGAISGVFEAWGRPMKVKVLGSVVDGKGKELNLKDYKVKNKQTDSHKKIPLFVFLGTRMDSGKTTMACKIVHDLKLMGKKAAAAKLTGVAFSQDLMKLTDAGAIPVLDFVDMGLPSTCNGNPAEIVTAALNLVDMLKASHPDCIIIEFGDAVLGEYHVADILQEPKFKEQIAFTVLAANDLAGVKGTGDILNNWGIGIDLVTGPLANSQTGVQLVRRFCGLTAESNQHKLVKTMKLVRSCL